MYAIIKTGGKQYRVEKDAIIKVELLKAEVGSEVSFDNILFVNNGSECHFGTPAIGNFVVKGKMIDTVRGPKVTSLKYRRRKNSLRKWGHRQHLSAVQITSIEKVEKK